MDQVAEIKSKVDIVQVIGERVKLRKAGRNYQGLCPFHNEKTPSFSVSQEMQIYKCFGCGESGDVITFLEKTEGLEFYEALKILADKAGVKLKKFDTQSFREKDQLKEANEDAARFYHYVLTSHPKGVKGLEYLKNRGLTMETIKTFRLGFATQDRALMSNNLIRKKKYTPKILEEAGLSYVKYGRAIDRFRGRVIYPITDIQGDVVALAGRILPELSDKGLAKYINSPETKIYHKSRSLFGLSQAKQEIKKLDYVVLVEGEMDFLSSWQANVKNVVAIKGTALTPDHITILSRFTKKITLALDTDFAGNNAALKGIAMAQNADMQIRAVDLGNFKDPDEYAQADTTGYKKAVENAVDVWEFLIDKLDQKYDLTTASGKSDASKSIVPLLSHIENEIVREHYLQKLSQKLGVSVESVSHQANRYKSTVQVQVQVQEKQEPKSKLELLEEELLVMLLRFYPKKLLTEDVLSQLNMRFSARIIKIFTDNWDQKQSFDVKTFVNLLPEELRERFAQMIIEYPEEPKKPQNYINELYMRLTQENMKTKKEELIKKIAIAEKGGDEEKVKELQESYRKLEQTAKSSIIRETE